MRPSGLGDSHPGRTGFNPRTPCGVRPFPCWNLPSRNRFQSTHSLRSATGSLRIFLQAHLVSIHALLAECDRDHPGRPMADGLFQSTHSLRSATPSNGICLCASRFQSTHSLRSATRPDPDCPITWIVSIHALLAECDRPGSVLVEGVNSFNPRTPCGVRLHKPLQLSQSKSFNPRTPCGVRLTSPSTCVATDWFQSTHSLRSATLVWGIVTQEEPVSIHALLAECDLRCMSRTHPPDSFNPRTPCGVRPGTRNRPRSTRSFNPRTPCGVRPLEPRQSGAGRSFNPRTPCGVRPI